VRAKIPVSAFPIQPLGRGLQERVDKTIERAEWSEPVGWRAGFQEEK